MAVRILACRGSDEAIVEPLAAQRRDTHSDPAIAIERCCVAGMVVLANLLTDLAYAVLDPRIRYS